MPARSPIPAHQDIRALSLDLDDTLWPLAPAIHAAESRLAAWFGAHAPRVLEGTSPEHFARLRRQVFEDRRDLAHDFSALRRLMIERVLVDAGYDPSLVDDAFETFLSARHAVAFFEDVLPALRRLAGRFPIVALTNGNACVRRLGLDGYFRAAVYARDVGRAKPAREMFETAAQRAGVQLEDLLHVGDDLHDDIGGAAAAGCRAVWINRRGERAPPGVVSTRCLGELAELLGC